MSKKRPSPLRFSTTVHVLQVGDIAEMISLNARAGNFLDRVMLFVVREMAEGECYSGRCVSFRKGDKLCMLWGKHTSQAAVVFREMSVNVLVRANK